ncbi:hypothetical protein L3N51_02403 [Metallosphaera sp. J1]|uniref:hypothetical protein n=1 Tax=Metallosphaera javensis (ex Hofmann et al. 2022) TaxID=99938 RepID=UPI001EDF77AD|nr:hypothetical protein [Metallosphaera javensis (ex Hofmann et al. 2022)]MCG3110106.1 hypothetical protein [Metallosphaera javensis (ex Hofmann et al. 2022)]
MIKGRFDELSRIGIEGALRIGDRQLRTFLILDTGFSGPYDLLIPPWASRELGLESCNDITTLRITSGEVKACVVDLELYLDGLKYVVRALIPGYRSDSVLMSINLMSRISRRVIIDFQDKEVNVELQESH